MKLLKSCSILFVLFFSTIIVQAQKKQITGKVVDETTNEPLEGVNVLIGKKKEGTTTKKDGTYTLEVTNKVVELTFSYVGYTPQTKSIGNDKVINVALINAIKTTDEVVVIGYGTQKKSSVTGAVAKYTNENLDEAPVSRLDQALQGRIAGVFIQNTSSEAGADPKVRVRALSSINAGADPLVVVDGHPLPDGLSFTNMGDVESVEVLKDAASTAIYGSRGASGVILITTKKGKPGKPKYSFKYAVGAKTAYKLYEVLSTTEYTNKLFYEATIIAKDPSVAPLTENTIANGGERGAYVIEQTLRGGVGTDWQSTAIRNANVKNAILNVSGGADKLSYYISANYQNDQGIMYHSEYERFNVMSKFDGQLSKKVKFTFNINPSYFKRETPSVNYIDFVRYPSYIPVYLDETTAAFTRQNPLFADVKSGDFAQARYFNGRVYSGTMPDGSTWINSSEIDAFGTATNSPKSNLETRTVTSNNYRLLTSGSVNVTILPGLDIKTLASSYVNVSDGLDFAKRNSNRAGDVNKGIYTNRTYIDLLSENTINYNKRVKQHSFNVLAGFTVQKTTIKQDKTTGLDYPSDDITTLNTALFIDQDKESTFSTKNQIGLVSYLGRFIYSFKDRYLLAASYRTDGSSYFSPGKKWGQFQSISIGWVASKEKFIKDIKWINNLKFRGSYGAVGNNRIVDFAFLDLLYAANYPFNNNTGTVSNGQASSTAIFPDPNITWERTYQYNGGIDLSILKNSITLSLDVFQSETDKLLLRQAALGFSGVPQTWNNIGKLQTNGIELQLVTSNINKKKIKWTTQANISHNTNKVIELGAEAQLLNQGERNELYLNTIGAPLVQFFGYKTDGVWLSQAQIDAEKAKGLTSPLTNMFVPGGLKLVDVNGDNVIDVKDRTVIGNPYPDFSWGISNNFKIGNFDCSFTFQGVQGGELINGDGNYVEIKRTNNNYNANRWLSPLNPGDGKTPYSSNGFNWMLTDYVVEDASYYALREVNVGYTIPAAQLKKIKINGLRFYFSAQNLYYHFAKGYRGINPESSFSSGPYNTPLVDGYQRGAYPINKTFLVGVGFNF